MQSAVARRQIRSSITWLANQIARLDEIASDMIATGGELKQRYDLLRSVPGAGPVLALALTAYLPEPGNLKPPRAGRARGSGALQPRERLLQWPAFNLWGKIQSPHRPVIWERSRRSATTRTARHLYERLVDAGKPKKVALVACLRKLLLTLNAVVGPR